MNQAGMSQNVTENQALTRAKSVLFLDPEKRTYDRYHRFIRLQFHGTVAKEAAKRAGLSVAAGYGLMSRIRKRAYAWAGGEIGDVLIIRLMCDRERAEAALKELRAKELFRAE